MISSKKIAKAVVSLSEKSPDGPQVAAGQLVDFVKKYRLEGLLSSIMSAISDEKKKRRDDCLLVESPFELNSDSLRLVRDCLKAPEETEIFFNKNPDLIGGFKAYWKDKRADGSLRNSLEKLRARLESNA
jgi:F0F1-type ATP synthase delta subunit